VALSELEAALAAWRETVRPLRLATGPELEARIAEAAAAREAFEALFAELVPEPVDWPATADDRRPDRAARDGTAARSPVTRKSRLWSAWR
jgi:hypothetical protein